MRKGSTSFGTCEVQCWRQFFGNEIQTSLGPGGRADRLQGGGAEVCGVGVGTHINYMCTSLSGPVHSAFRALFGRLKFTVRCHKFNTDSLSVQIGGKEGVRRSAAAPSQTMPVSPVRPSSSTPRCFSTSVIVWIYCILRNEIYRKLALSACVQSICVVIFFVRDWVVPLRALNSSHEN